MRYIAWLMVSGLLLWAQPPNDNPCGAITLTPSAGCTYVNGNLNGATATPGIPAPGCANYQGGDVWYAFPVPLSGRVIIQVNSSYDLGMAIYSAATCTGPFTLIECNDDDGPGLNPTICRTGGSNTGCTGIDPGVTCTYNAALTAGTTIWIRIWRYNNGTPGDTPFQICVIDCGSGGGGGGSGCNAANYTAYSCPCPGPGGGSWCGAGCTSAGITSDDVYAPNWTTLPFNFYFAGSTYNQILIGANGDVVFPPSGFTPGGYDGWGWGGYTSDLYSIQFQLDINPALGGTICYRTIGSAPNRCLVVQYCNVPYFSCTNLTFTGELRLCENGSIQINIANMPVCSGWNGGGCFVGIIGGAGDMWAIHNAQPCPALTNTCYAFTPPLSCQASTPPAGCVPLAAVIERFEGSLRPEGIRIEWDVAEEEDILSYRVERSGDLQRWESIGELPPQGSGSHYFLVDDAYPRQYSSLYYRLVVVEQGGGEKAYGPIEVVLTEKRPIRPERFELRTGENLRLHLGTGEEVRAAVYDASGRRTFEGYFSGPGEAEIPAVFFGRGFNILLLEVMGGETAAYRILHY